MQTLAVVLAPGSVNHIANIVKGYAIAIGVAFAIWIVWQWWRARNRELTADRAARAKGVWARHLALALQHPELAEPMLGSLSSAAEVARYRTFVASLLAAADEILSLEATDSWRATLARHLAAHRSYLASADFRNTGLADCSEAVRALIGRVTGS
jgi:threonine/homoserine/homoserine lactone efflux protein